MKPYIDLHTHSTCSDGLLSPAALVDLAARRGLAAIALTDHDTVAGLPEAIAHGRESGVEVIPGIEIGAEALRLSLHILGYGFNQKHPGLLAFIARLQQAREARNRSMIEKLATLGIRMPYEQLTAMAGDQAGRPHFARLLVKHGHAADSQDAFSRFLKRGAPAFIAQVKPTAEEAITRINEAGGLAVIAHPGSSDPGLEKIPGIIPTLKEYGLAGMEIFYPTHSKKIIRLLQGLAEQYGLLPTGGTDYHGDSHSLTPLGGNAKTIRIPLSVLAGLKTRLAEASARVAENIGIA